MAKYFLNKSKNNIKSHPKSRQLNRFFHTEKQQYMRLKWILGKKKLLLIPTTDKEISQSMSV